MLTKLVISLCLPMSVWTVFVCLPACLKNTHPNFAKLLFCSCNKMWPWLSPHLTTVQYGYVLPVLWMTSWPGIGDAIIMRVLKATHYGAAHGRSVMPTIVQLLYILV